MSLGAASYVSALTTFFQIAGVFGFHLSVDVPAVDSVLSTYVFYPYKGAHSLSLTDVLISGQDPGGVRMSMAPVTNMHSVGQELVWPVLGEMAAIQINESAPALTTWFDSPADCHSYSLLVKRVSSRTDLPLHISAKVSLVGPGGAGECTEAGPKVLCASFCCCFALLAAIWARALAQNPDCVRDIHRTILQATSCWTAALVFWAAMFWLPISSSSVVCVLLELAALCLAAVAFMHTLECVSPPGPMEAPWVRLLRHALVLVATICAVWQINYFRLLVHQAHMTTSRFVFYGSLVVWAVIWLLFCVFAVLAASSAARKGTTGDRHTFGRHSLFLLIWLLSAWLILALQAFDDPSIIQASKKRNAISYHNLVKVLVPLTVLVAMSSLLMVIWWPSKGPKSPYGQVSEAGDGALEGAVPTEPPVVLGLGEASDEGQRSERNGNNPLE